MKSLKYEGMVKLKIFWKLRRFEASLSGFKSKRVHYGKLGLQIILNHLISPQPNTPSLLPYQQNRHLPPFFQKNRVGPPPSIPNSFFFSSSSTHHFGSLSLFKIFNHFRFLPFSPPWICGSWVWSVAGRTAAALAFRQHERRLVRKVWPTTRGTFSGDGGPISGERRRRVARWTIVLSFSGVFFLFQLHFSYFLSFLLLKLGNYLREGVFRRSGAAAGGGGFLFLILEFRKSSDHRMILIFGLSSFF